MSFQQNQYYEELKNPAAQVEDAKRNELALAKQFDAMALRTDIENKRLYKELEETKDIGAKTLYEADSKLNKFKGTYNATLSELQNRYVEDLSRDKNKLDTLHRENEQLRNFVAGGNPGSYNSNNMVMM